ncbi:MAG: DUF547 domain-containing protein [Flavobacteriales bacterium]|nr:DUF547 domain-containing protein [Flavobacteriales bacterium]
MIYLVSALLTAGLLSCQQPATSTTNYTDEQGTIVSAASAPAGVHETWDLLLRAHVKGPVVDYKGMLKDKAKIDLYCVLLKNMAPRDEWTKQEKLAYYINLYNAQTVKLIVDNYPVESIRDLEPKVSIPGVNSVWHATKFMVGDKELSLNDVEHEILRKMGDPRIHFAINCASISCPPLRNEAYTADKLEQQLADQAKTFINSDRYNKITASAADLSAIFDWFGGDFTKEGTLVQYLNKYSTTKIDQNAKVTYLDYDWKLNDVK